MITAIEVSGKMIEVKAANDNVERKKVVKVRQQKGNFPEEQLWKVVICQAIEDATTKSGKRHSAYVKRMAIEWLTGNSKDFKIVCDYAGYSYEEVRKSAIKIIANDNNPDS